MDAATRQSVRQRALDRCEYCRLPQSAQPFVTFHVEHVIARQHGGTDHLDNLCLACERCNLSFEPLNPHHYSFNSPLGWCPTCEGLGFQRGVASHP